MSLINEALKKAQNQRTVELTAVPSPASTTTPTSTDAQPQVRITKRPPPLSAGTLIGLLGGGVFGLLAVGVVSYFYFSAPSTPPTEVATTNPHAAPIATVKPAPAKPPIAGVTPTGQPTQAPQIISVSLPPIPGSQTGIADLDSVFTPPQLRASRATAAPAVPAANSTIRDLVDTLRISVVRLTPTDPKVVLNGQVFRINDVVDRGLKVRLSKIEAARLVFSDANGFEYIKPY
jgi:hypothetical protein